MISTVYLRCRATLDRRSRSALHEDGKFAEYCRAETTQAKAIVHFSIFHKRTVSDIFLECYEKDRITIGNYCRDVGNYYCSDCDVVVNRRYENFVHFRIFSKRVVNGIFKNVMRKVELR